VAYAKQVQDQTITQLLLRALEALGVTAAVAVAAGWWIAGRLLRPLRQITTTAQRLSHQTLHERIRLRRPNDELKELADTFDSMLTRLQTAFESQRRFVANASHELRTPLSEERALVDVTLADHMASEEELRGALRAVRDAVDEQERIIEGLLTLARSERGLERQQPVDVKQVAAAALRKVEHQAATTHVRLQRDLSFAPVSGDRALLERMVGNLLDNAVWYNDPGGWVRLSTRSENSHIELEVINSGQHVAPEAVPALFEPFRRLDGRRAASRDGLGLGLSIVRAVAVAHGGTVEAAARSGGGLHVTVRMPSANAAALDGARGADPIGARERAAMHQAGELGV
jgi:signal transduction histidine kinase